MSRVRFDLLAAPGHLIRRAQQHHAALWVERVDAELTSVQFAVLVAVHERPGLDQRTLGTMLSIDGSTVADVCRRMAERGLIVRERSPDDARRYGLGLTAQGEAVLRQLAPRVAALGEDLLGPLTQRERETLMRLLRKVVLRG
ncbi:MAG TPA: MarR family transcriptional regulator [Solirubrobacteraceae bacterium]